MRLRDTFTKSEPYFRWLFYIGFLFFLLSSILLSPTDATKTTIHQIVHFAGRFGSGLLALRILTFLPRHTRYALICICMLAVFRVSHLLGGGRYLFYLTLVVGASRDANIKVALKIQLACFIFFLVACPLSYLLGWTDNVTTHMGELQGGSYGFGGPNTLAAVLSMAAVLALFLSKERRVVVIWCICWLTAAIVFYLTLCQTWTLLLLVLPILYLLFSIKSPKPWLLAVLPVGCLAVSILLAIHFGPGYGQSTFDSRFSIAALVYEKYGLSPFGQDCNLDDWFKGVFPYKLTIDNGFLNIFLCSGVVMGFFAMAFLTHLLFLLGKKEDRLLAAITCCYVVSGMMEHAPFDIHFTFLPLFYLSLVKEYAPATEKMVAPWSFALAGAVAVYVFMPWNLHWNSPSPTPQNGVVGDIPCPAGFTQVKYEPDSFSGYVESLPLARPDSVVANYDGTRRDSLAYLCYRVVDFPLIDMDEQCADVCMRLRAEYLFGENQFRKISFADTRGKTLRYYFGACHPMLNRYIKNVFAWSNTESLRASTPSRRLDEIIPGDMFVYDKDSRPGEKYGHAVMVAGVAVDTLSGRKAVLLIQGSTPACDIHVIANPDASEFSPWFLLDETGDSTPVLTVGKAVFYAEDLRHFSTQKKQFPNDSEIPSYARALLLAYPDLLSHFMNGRLYFQGGGSLLCDDGEEKSFLERLDRPDVEDMFHDVYTTSELITPGYLYDPGRYRCDELFKRMYGSTKRKVQKNLVLVDWFDQQIPFTTVNHAADSLKAVEREIKATYPQYLEYFSQSSSFNWRPVRGANRMSAHSYGIAIDICVDYSNYWRLSNPEKEELDEIVYQNRIPEEIIHVFERHGFISGARWYHYDTMHFEFRPELLVL